MNHQRYPKISVITPSFNQGEYLEETLLSVLDQQYPNLEYLVLDGGSSDLSPLIIDRYRDRLAYVRVGRDQGQYHAVQEGIDRSTGELVAWINSDDKLHRDSLWTMAEAAARFPDDEWFTGLPSVWNRFGQLQFVNEEPPEWDRTYLESILDNPQPWYIQQESTFFRRSIWEKTGASFDLDMRLAADYDLWLRFTQVVQVRQLRALIGGFRIQPKQRSAVQRERYREEVARAIAKSVSASCAADATKSAPPCPVPPPALLGDSAYLRRIDDAFEMATSIAPHKQLSQYRAIQTWIRAGFQVVSFNDPSEIEILSPNFPDVRFVPVCRTAREVTGKPLVFIKDVLAYFRARGTKRCGIFNSDISLVNTVGMLEAFGQALQRHDAVFASRIEVEQPDRQLAAYPKPCGLPSIRFGSIYIWGFDLFLFGEDALRRIDDCLPHDSLFAFGVPWWDYIVPSYAMRLGLDTAIFYPPPITHPTHPANYNWRLWQLFGHLYMQCLGLHDRPVDIEHFAPQLDDELLQRVSQQVVQLLVRTSAKVDLGCLVQQPDAIMNGMGYTAMSEDVIRQLSVAHAFPREPFVNLAYSLRDHVALDAQRRASADLLRERGLPHAA